MDKYRWRSLLLCALQACDVGDHAPARDTGIDDSGVDAGPHTQTDTGVAAPHDEEPPAKGVHPYVGEQTVDTRGSRAQTPEFSWPSTADAAYYELQVDDSCDLPSPDCSFPSPEVNATNLPTPGFTPDSPLPISSVAPLARRYYWHWRACSAASCGSWSSVFYFDIGPGSHDYNADGYADVLGGIGPYAITPGSEAGQAEVQVFFGGPQPNADPDANFTLSAISWTSARSSPNGLGAAGYPSFAVNLSGLGTITDGRRFTFAGGSSIAQSPPLEGTRVALGRYTLEVTQGPIGDINGDGKLDWIQTSRNTTYTHDVSVCAKLTIDGQEWPIAPPMQPNAYCNVQNAGDITGDGFADLLVANVTKTDLGRPLPDSDRAPETNVLAIIPGGPNFDGKAWRTLAIPSAEFHGGIDLNGDRYMDLLVASGDAIELRLGGTSSPFATVALSLPATRVLGSADADGDGYLDVLAAAGDDVLLFLGGEVMDANADATWHGMVAQFVGDVNKDGRADLLTKPAQRADGAKIELHWAHRPPTPRPT